MKTQRNRHRALFDQAALLAMAGILADHVDMADAGLPGEKCAQTVARLALIQAGAMVDALYPRDMGKLRNRPILPLRGLKQSK